MRKILMVWNQKLLWTCEDGTIHEVCPFEKWMQQAIDFNGDHVFCETYGPMPDMQGSLQVLREMVKKSWL